jgi:hypothetical protein
MRMKDKRQSDHEGMLRRSKEFREMYKVTLSSDIDLVYSLLESVPDSLLGFRSRCGRDDTLA